MEENKTSFTAILYQIKTEPSGGWRITFDVPETDSDRMIDLSKMRDLPLMIGVVVNG